ncbi:MAG: galactokinase [Chitinophagales bacterium]|nr:galactokinase [Chitinophagales bacterium]
MTNTQKLLQDFEQQYNQTPSAVYFAPGRINLIGEHIDYNGGRVLPAAISLGISAAVASNNDNTIALYANQYQQAYKISIDEVENYEINKNNIQWYDYVIACLKVLIDKNIRLQAKSIVLDSNLPLGAGLSSSAALECLILYIFNQNYYSENRIQLALDAQLAETKYIGVQCGIMDQFAVALGKQNHSIYLDCATLDYTYIPTDFQAYQIVIINSNQSRSLAHSAYNERRQSCEMAFKIVQQFDPADNLSQVHPISLSYIDDDELYFRAKHVITESGRVEQAVLALQKNEFEIFGQLLTASHQSLADDYEVSSEALNIIVHYATHFSHCLGARMIGAGFGGCCIALVEKEYTKQFINYVSKKYTEKANQSADFYIANIVDGVKQIV